MTDLALEFGVSAKAIGDWLRLSEESGDSISEDERIELRRLHKANHELRKKEILTKSASSPRKVDEIRVGQVVACKIEFNKPVHRQ
jgi:hypothetical protein